jgi:transglutaminase-like putative cysteine protease
MGSRDPKDVYEENKGTCSGKNFLLRELYKAIGVPTKDMICLQRWKDLTWFPDDTYGTVKLPEELTQLLETTEVVDFHNYVKILVDGRWVTVDVTIDVPLLKLGFYTTEHWDGKSDMPLCFVGTHKVWDCGDQGLERKAELTAMLPQEIRDARLVFLKKLTMWIDSLRDGEEI